MEKNKEIQNKWNQQEFKTKKNLRLRKSTFLNFFHFQTYSANKIPVSKNML